jgi:hypothetical protein
MGSGSTLSLCFPPPGYPLSLILHLDIDDVLSAIGSYFRVLITQYPEKVEFCISVGTLMEQ